MKIGVVTAAYITTEFHFNIAVQTVLSLYGLKSAHSLFPVITVNACTTGASHLAWFKKSFDHFIVNDRNNLARAWNHGIRAALDAHCDYILVINLDLVFHSQFLDNLVRFAADHPDAIAWSGQPWPEQTTLEQADLGGNPMDQIDTSCFMFDRRLPEKIGFFDEQFEPAYHEDSDMVYRIKLAGERFVATPTARYFHLGQVTLKGSISEKQEEFLSSTRILMNESMERYKKKWGGLPGQEAFTAPYGSEKTDVKN